MLVGSQAAAAIPTSMPEGSQAVAAAAAEVPAAAAPPVGPEATERQDPKTNGTTPDALP